MFNESTDASALLIVTGHVACIVIQAPVSAVLIRQCSDGPSKAFSLNCEMPHPAIVSLSAVRICDFDLECMLAHDLPLVVDDVVIVGHVCGLSSIIF